MQREYIQLFNTFSFDKRKVFKHSQERNKTIFVESNKKMNTSRFIESRKYAEAFCIHENILKE